MNRSNYYPLGSYQDATKPTARRPVQKTELVMTKDNQTEIELADVVSANPTSLVFINGILISKQEYSISENMLTLVSPVNTNDRVTIVK